MDHTSRPEYSPKAIGDDIPKVLPQESDLPEVTDTQLSIFDDLGGV